MACGKERRKSQDHDSGAWRAGAACKMCLANSAESLAQSMGRRGRELSALQELAGLLGLENTPKYIESYDISHTAGSDNVGAMVVFENGRPLKSAYKKFEIKTVNGQDDYASMREVLDRRFSHYGEQKDTERASEDCLI